MSKRQMRRERGRSREHRAEQPQPRFGLLFSIDGSAVREAFDRIAQAAIPLAEALGCFGMAISDFARSAVARYAEHEEAALHLSIRTLLTPEQARSLIQEHGLELAERVGELVSLAWPLDRAVEVVSGRDAQGHRLVSQYMDLPSPESVEINPSGPLRGFVGAGWFKRAPIHGTPSTFVEVCGDAAVAKHQPVLTPCATCRNHDNNTYLSCAIQPLGRPGHECGDWEAECDRIEVVTYANGRREVLWREGMSMSSVDLAIDAGLSQVAPGIWI